MKKIACIGSHSTGKTTLTFQLAEQSKRVGENPYIISERVRFSPFQINSGMTIETSFWASCSQIARELETAQRGFSLLICDRTPYDTFLYAKYFKLDSPLMPQFESMAKSWLQTYDEIYFVRPGKDHIALEDGVRSTDKEFIHGVDTLFAEFVDSTGLKVKTIYTDEVFA
jgi:nicotinamide riboside kinase